MSCTFRNHANTFRCDRSETLKRNKTYGKIVDEFDMEFDGHHYKAELRYGDRQGGYMFTGIANVTSSTDYIVKTHKDGDVVRKQIREAMLLIVTVTWKPFIHLYVDTDPHGGAEHKAGFVLSYDYLLVGTRVDGSFCYKKARVSQGESYDHDVPPGELVEANGEHVNDGKPDVGQGDYTTSRGLIPYTPENKARLEAVVTALEDLGKKVSKLLTGKDAAKIVSALMGPALTFKAKGEK